MALASTGPPFVQNDTHFHWAKFARCMVSKGLTPGSEAEE